MQNNFTPDKTSIYAHISAIAGDSTDGLIEIAYTPAESRAVNQAKFFAVSDIDKAADYAASINATEGVNVYIGAALRDPNTAPFSRSDAEDFYKSYYAWADLDDADAAKNARDKYKDLPPSFVVVTGRTPDLRAQVWWRLAAHVADKPALKNALAHVCSALDGDKSVVDPARVMRLAGSIAWPKKEGRIPEQTELIIPVARTESVSLDDLTRHFPLAADPVDNQAAAGVGVGLFNSPPRINLSYEGSEWSLNDIESLLDHIHPDDEYIGWVKIGMALKDYGVPFEIWDRWSSRGMKYNAREMRAKWDSFRGSGTTIGSLVYLAKQGGWKPKQAQHIVLNPIGGREYKEDQETEEPKTEEQPKNKFFYTNAPDIGIDLEVNDFVQGLLTENALSVVYGESNCGKTFFMSDLAFHVAQGKKYNGRRVEKGNVLYLSLEGKRGIKNRIAAYKMENNVDIDGFLMMPCQVDFINSEEDVPQLVDLIISANKKFNSNIKLIVIDTLARALGGGDENSGIDMGTLVKHSDLIRQYTNAHICFIHHTGKDKARGARGHSSLRAAVDTEIEVSREDKDDYSTVKIPKQRDMEKDDDFHFTLKRVVLGVNKYKEEVTSCVVVPFEAPEKKKQERMTALQTFVYDGILACLSVYGKERQVLPGYPTITCITYEELRGTLEEKGMKGMIKVDSDGDRTDATPEQVKSATQTARISLQKMGKISFNNKYIWLI